MDDAPGNVNEAARLDVVVLFTDDEGNPSVEQQEVLFGLVTSVWSGSAELRETISIAL